MRRPARRAPLLMLFAVLLLSCGRAQSAGVRIERVPPTSAALTLANVPPSPGARPRATGSPAATSAPATAGTAPAAASVAPSRPPARTATPAATAARTATPQPAAGTATASSTPAPRLAPARAAPPAPTSQPSEGHGDSGLQSVIVAALGDDADHAAVVATRLADGATASWNGDRVYYAASLYKLEVLYEAYRQRELGAISFDQMVSVGDHYLEQDLGTFSRVPVGPNGEVAVGDAVRAMITFSDNVSATLLLDLLGHRSIDATMAALGLTSTSVNTTDLPTTAADMARLMAAIASGEGLTPGSASEMTALLLAQENRAGIPRGVPAGVPVGNKWGSWDADLHDVAVVLAPAGSYVLAVLTDGPGGWDLISRVSRAVYGYWDGTNP